jgi:hypothetical protein
VQNIEPDLDLIIDAEGLDTKAFSVNNAQCRTIDFTVDFTSAMGIEIEGSNALKVTRRLKPMSTTPICRINLLQGARLNINFNIVEVKMDVT